MELYQFLCEELSASKQEVSRYAISAPKKYKVYKIPKRTSGQRTIAHPAKTLKRYQRVLTRCLEKILPVHKAAYAYRKNIGIKHNALQHQNSRYLLKMDFQDFFHSISPELFFSIIEEFNIDLTKDDRFLLKQLLFWCPSKKSDGKLILSIGAPSSPLISNFIMYIFDKILSDDCKKRGVTYTRYADDITFSTNKKNSLFEIPAVVKSLLLEQLDGAISIKESKTVFSSTAHNRHITGVTLTNDNKISIGRKRKRYLSSMIHKYSLGILPSEEISYLQGFLSFANDIEPDFKQKMIAKYSFETIDQLVKEPI